MKIEHTAFVQEYMDMATYGDQLGWHERNGGNFTYWISQEEIASISDMLDKDGEWMTIGTNVKELAKEYFLISGTGKYFHNIKKDPRNNIGIIQIDEEGDFYRICWGFEDGGRPTSELPTHLMNLNVRKTITKGQDRVIYHAHCPNIIALSFLLPIKADCITRELWEMMTECPVIFPEGVGVVEWMVPGGKDIAMATSKQMEHYRAVLWAHHGIFCCGATFDETFGLMHTIEKSAEIWIKVHSVASQKRQTITTDNFKQLANDFHVTLNEQALYYK